MSPCRRCSLTPAPRTVVQRSRYDAQMIFTSSGCYSVAQGVREPRGQNPDDSRIVVRGATPPSVRDGAVKCEGVAGVQGDVFGVKSDEHFTLNDVTDFGLARKTIEFATSGTSRGCNSLNHGQLTFVSGGQKSVAHGNARQGSGRAIAGSRDHCFGRREELRGLNPQRRADIQQRRHRWTSSVSLDA